MSKCHIRFFFSIIIFAYAVATQAQEPVNLLRIPQASVIETHLLDEDKTVLGLLTDNDNSRPAINIGKAVPLEFVFEFSDVVSAEKLVVHFSTSSQTEGPVEISLLVSNLSAQTGFKALRDVLVDPGRHSWEFDFKPVAGRWLLLQITPTDESANNSVAEIEVLGSQGEPQSPYEFKQSPVDAIALLSQLNSTVDFNFGTQEQTLFTDAEDGILDNWSFAEAALLASGVESVDERREYTEQIYQLEQSAAHDLSSLFSVYDKGLGLLQWLHEHAFYSGYQLEQTDLSTVLSSGTYNCVSSSVLYNILAKRIGIDARGIEVPDHALSIVYDGTNHVDVETTTEHGFNPSRNQQAQQAFQSKTGYTYIADRHADKRREIDEMGMIALIYYNHGVSYYEDGDYYQSLLANFRALSLDPENLSAVKNALASLSNWSLHLSDQEQYEKAIDILTLGLKLAPQDRSLNHNFKAVWQRYINKSIDTQAPDQTIALINRAHQYAPDSGFDSLESWVFIKQGQELVNAEQWQQALDLIDKGMTQVNQRAIIELERWRTSVIFRWSSKAIDYNDWATAMDILVNQPVADSDQYKIDRQLGYITQEWGNDLLKNSGLEQAEQKMKTLLGQFPNQRFVIDAVRNFAYKVINELVDSNQIDTAIKKSQRYHDLINDKKTHDRLVVSLFSQQAMNMMESKDFSGALDVLEKGRQLFPDNRTFKQNIAYSVQEWVSEFSILYPDQLITELSILLSRFDDVSEVAEVAENFVIKRVNALTDEQQYEKAISFIQQNTGLMKSQRKYKELLRYSFFLWSEKYYKNKNYSEAVSVYIKAFKELPNDSQLKQNAIATWHGWAEQYISKKQWRKAIEIYKQGLVYLPNTNLFKQNIKYCEQHL